MVNPILARLNAAVTPPAQETPPTTTQAPTGNPILDGMNRPDPAPAPDVPRPSTGNPILDRIGDQPQTDPLVEEGARLAEIVATDGKIPSFAAAPEQVTAIAAYIGRLNEYGKLNDDQEAIDFAQQMRSMASEVIPDDIAARYGLDEIEIKAYADNSWLGKGLRGIGETVPGANFVGREILMPTINFADSASQGTLAAIGSVREGEYWEGAQAFSQGVTYGGVGNLLEDVGIVDEHNEQGVLDAARAKYDQDGDGSLNWREAQGLSSEGGGRLAGFFDTVLVGIFDPFTWVGVGAAGRARAGLTAVAATQGDEVARAVARSGLDQLDDVAQREVQSYLTEQIAKSEAARRAGFFERLGIAPADVPSKVDDVLQNLQGGVGTVRVGPTNISIPGFDSAVYRARPGFGTGLKRGNVTTRTMDNIFDQDDAVRFDAAQEIFGANSQIDDVTLKSLDDIDAWRSSQWVTTPVPDSATQAMVGQGTLLDDAGEAIGSWERTLFDDGTAWFDVLTVPGGGKGEASAFLEEQVKNLGDAGFHTIRLDAAMDGPLTWGRKGFVIDTARQADVEEWLDHMIYQIDQQIDELPGGTSRPVRGGQQDLFDQRPEGMIPGSDNVRTGGRTGRPGAEFDPKKPAGLDNLPEGAVVNRDVLENLRDKFLRARENPTTANIADLGDPSSNQWRVLDQVVDDWGSLPMVRGIGVKSALEVAEGGGPRLGQRIAGTEFGQKFSYAFRPRGEIQTKLGDLAEEAFDTARVQAGSQLDNAMSDLFQRLNGVADEAAREAGSLEAADAIVRDALETVDTTTLVTDSAGDIVVGQLDDLATVRRLAADIAVDQPAVARYLETMGEIRETITEAAQKAGLADGQARQGYFPRTLTEAGREAVLESDDLLEQMGLDAAKLRSKEARFHHPRTFMPDASIDEVNRKLSEILDLPEGTKLFEDNVIGAFAQRGDAAFRAASQMDMLEGLTKVSIGEGADRAPMVIRLADGEAKPKGYQYVPDIGQEWVAKAEVVKEIERMRHFITNNEAMAGAAEFMNNWSKTWGAYATAPLIDGLGFHSRNAASNIMLNLTAGVGDPRHYSRAMNLQRTMAKAFKSMADEGISFDEALDRIRRVSPEDAEMIRLARANGIIDKGWFEDIAPSTRTARPRGQGLLTTYDGSWDFLQNNKLVTTGRALGQAVEHNARLAHFIAKIQAGESAEASARSVRKFLFDYGDLTGFEEGLKVMSRFYTFMRKNLGVQLWALTRNPGRVNAIQRATGGGLSGALGLNPGVPGQPEYSQERGDNLSLGGILGVGASDNLTGGIETPFQAFSENFIRPIVQIAGIIEGDGTTQSDILQSILGLTSGGQRSFADLIYQNIAQYNTAFGREFTEEERGAENNARRWLDTLIGPVWSQFDTAVERFTEGEGVGSIGNNPSTTSEQFGTEVFILANILGINAARLDTEEEQDRDLVFLLQEELEGYLEQMKEDGKQVPTIQELRDAGILPPAPESPDLAGSVTTQRKIDEAREAGLPTDLLEAELAERLASEGESYTEISADGTYTTREGRAHELASQLESYVLDDNGEPKRDDDGNLVTSVNSLVKAEWNRRHPDQPYLNSDGSPVDYYNVPIVWPTATNSEVLDWFREGGALIDGEPISPYRTSLTKEMRRIYNEQHPERQSLTVRERLENGIRPIQGVHEVIEDGRKIGEVWPEGMSADNWSVTGGSAPPSSGGGNAIDDLFGS